MMNTIESLTEEKDESDVAVGTVVDLVKVTVALLIASPFISSVGVPMFITIGVASGLLTTVVAIMFLVGEEIRAEILDALFATALITTAMMVGIAISMLAVVSVSHSISTIAGLVAGLFFVLVAYMWMDTPTSIDAISITPQV